MAKPFAGVRTIVGRPSRLQASSGRSIPAACMAARWASRARRPAGAGTSDGQATPPAAPAGRTYRSIDAGFVHSCAVFDDNNAQCWRYNGEGGANVPAGNTWQAISAGALHSCGLKTNGTVACWGRDAEGQVGQHAHRRVQGAVRRQLLQLRHPRHREPMRATTSPVVTPPVGTFVALSSGAEHACAIRSDGVRLCWGFRGDGQTPNVVLGPATFPAAQVGRGLQFAGHAERHVRRLHPPDSRATRSPPARCRPACG